MAERARTSRGRAKAKLTRVICHGAISDELRSQDVEKALNSMSTAAAAVEEAHEVYLDVLRDGRDDGAEEWIQAEITRTRAARKVVSDYLKQPTPVSSQKVKLKRWTILIFRVNHVKISSGKKTLKILFSRV